MERFYILPFDHRTTFAKGLIHVDYPVTNASDRKRIKQLKRIVFDAFLQARRHASVPMRDMGILVDEEFGSNILREAKTQDIIHAVSVERSGQPFFQFEHGNAFGAQLTKRNPHYAKVLVRFDRSQTEANKIQIKRLQRLNNYCQASNQPWILELIPSGKGTKFSLLKYSIALVRKAGIDPDVWKLEGLESKKQWKEIRKIAKGDIIVLGHGKTKEAVEQWVKIAAASGSVNGFAIGRTIFFEPLESYLRRDITKTEAIERITNNYLHFIRLWKSYETR